METPAPLEVRLRDVEDADLEAFFRYEQEPRATEMAGFPARDRDAFWTHWAKVRANPTALKQTTLVGDEVAGNIGSWVQDGFRMVGYWLGSEFWGRGIATRALALFVAQIPERPLFAQVFVKNPASMRVLEKCGFRRLEADHPLVASSHAEEVAFILR